MTLFTIGDRVTLRPEQYADHAPVLRKAYAIVRNLDPFRVEWYADGQSLKTLGVGVRPEFLEPYIVPPTPNARRAQMGLSLPGPEFGENMRQVRDEIRRRFNESHFKPLDPHTWASTPGTPSEAVRIESRQPEDGSTGQALAHGDRMDEYGDPSASFQRIAELWSALVSNVNGNDDTVIEPEDVARMMILLKVSRTVTDKKADTLDDIDGYVETIRLLRAANI